MNTSPVRPARAAAAVAIAIFADLLQIPITAMFFTGFLAVPSEIADVVVDTAAAVLITALIGFDIMLLPTFVLELVPGLDLLPTWLGCTAYVVWRKRRQEATATERSPSQDDGEAPAEATGIGRLRAPLTLDVSAVGGTPEEDRAERSTTEPDELPAPAIARRSQR
jgi:hypothetical protein